MTEPNNHPLYVRYMEAFSASTKHTGTCTACQNSQDCATGEPIHTAFAKAQDAYQARQSAKRRS
ncbi:hypothetical protein OG625_40030 (plasmid) [Streptomyces sp. NBC_01351]|uniref:hypothetical protein n=1 Tax=Streptomyces sp. NBC_01351 TaxID=2903833 RepID=UPI002E3236D5|nr:hypothetical protein [Streptomyces sp. NBC_01351]